MQSVAGIGKIAAKAVKIVLKDVIPAKAGIQGERWSGILAYARMTEEKRHWGSSKGIAGRW